MSLGYETGVKELSLKVQFFGEARGRWPLIRDLAEVIHELGYLKFVSPPFQSRQELTLDCSIEKARDLVLTLVLFEKFSALSLVDSGPFEMFFDLDWSEDFNKEYPDLLKDVANIAALRAKSVLVKDGGDQAARKCMEQLVNKGYAYEIAVQAEILIFVHNGSAKKMLQKLLKEPQGAGIIQWTKENFTHSNPYIQTKAYQLIDLGVNECSSYPMDFAIEAVRKGLNSTESNVRSKSFKLMQSLVSKGHEYKMALRAAQKGISDSDVEVRSAAYQFLEFLLDKDQVHGTRES